MSGAAVQPPAAAQVRQALAAHALLGLASKAGASGDEVATPSGAVRIPWKRTRYCKQLDALVVCNRSGCGAGLSSHKLNPIEPIHAMHARAQSEVLSIDKTQPQPLWRAGTYGKAAATTLEVLAWEHDDSGDVVASLQAAGGSLI